MRPDLCPQRDLGLRDAESAAEFYGPGSPEAERAMDLYRSAQAAAVPVEYHLSEDPDDSDLQPEPRSVPARKLIPGRWWQWLLFFELALVGWIVWYLRGLF